MCVLGRVILAEWGVGAGAGRGECRARHSERSQPGTTWTSASCSVGEIPTAEVGARVSDCAADCAGARARLFFL